MATHEFIQQLAERPRETLNTELKGWLDLENVGHAAKLVRTILSLRNFDGGYLMVGFDDTTLLPNDSPDGIDPKSHYKQDAIDILVNRYSATKFEIFVHYPVVDGIELVVIEVPGGIKVPVVTKAKLIGERGKYLIKDNTLYTRTLNRNNTPSTSEAKSDDWPDILDRCFLNREADIAAFVKRHLSNSGIEAIEALLNINKSEVTVYDEVNKLMNNSYAIFEQKAAQNSIPRFGSYEVAIKVSGDLMKHNVDDDFQRLINASNKNYTGFPSWSIFGGSNNDVYTQEVYKKAWQSTVASLDNTISGYVEFWRISPDGEFYLLRYLPDDIDTSDKRPVPGSSLDYQLNILRISEVFLSALDIIKNMTLSEVALICEVRWSGMNDRKINNWTSPVDRHYLNDRKCSTDVITAQFEFNSGIAHSSLADVLTPVFNELFNHFNGFSVDVSEVKLMVDRLIQGRMRMF